MGPVTVIEARHWREIRPRDWPFPHFAPRELASRGNGAVRTSLAAGERLETLRRLIGRPLIVNSAYRDPLHNARVGGAPLSRHKVGDAFDVALDDARLYRAFLHLDCRPRPAVWYGKGGLTAWA